MHPLRILIRRFDAWLSRRYGIEPFTEEEGVILRLQIGQAPCDLPLPGVLIRRGTPALWLHLWNERMPPMPSNGPDLAYALRLQRQLLFSLRAVGRHLLLTPELRIVRVIGGVTAHITKELHGGGTLLERLGFTVFPYHQPVGAFGEFWENFYTWWLMWAFNPPSVRGRPLGTLQRFAFWMTTERFLERYRKEAA